MSVTAVPLRPVNRRGIVILWAGVAVLIAAAIAWALFLSNPDRTRLPSGVVVETIKAGTGDFPTNDDVVLVNYRGRLASNGKVFDEGQRAPFPVGQVVPGFAEGLRKMRVGGHYIVNIPAEQGYGEAGAGESIPPNSDLIFDVELLDKRSMAEIQAMQQQQMMQQMMQQQQGGAAPGGR